MLGTFGLTHIALAVRDPERSAAFYSKVFGCTETWRSDGWIEVSTPGCHDIITFRSDLPNPGKSAGVVHFGFRLRSPDEIDAIVEAAKRAGAKIKERGEFSPGHPYAYFNDPDGYEVEVWYE